VQVAVEGVRASVFTLIEGVPADGCTVSGGIREGVYWAWATAAKVAAAMTNSKIVLYFMSNLLLESN
jgi:hypothetical protein